MSISPWRILFTLSSILLVLLLFTFPFLTPGTASYVVALLSLSLLVVTAVGAAILLRLDWNPF
ncbi:hypothetical protein [Haladaptatus sp. NG-SE-30]